MPATLQDSLRPLAGGRATHRIWLGRSCLLRGPRGLKSKLARRFRWRKWPFLLIHTKDLWVSWAQVLPLAT